MSLADHPLSGPLPSLAAAAAVVGSGQGQSSSSSNSASSLPLISLPPLPPPAGAGAMMGHCGADSMHAQQGSMMVPSSASGSMHHRHSSSEHDHSGSNGSGSKAEGNGRAASESLLEVGGPGAGGGGGGGRMLSHSGMGGPFGGMGPMGSMGSGGSVRDRDGSPSLSGQVGGARGVVGRPPTASMGGYSNGGVSGAGGSGSRSGAPSLLQHADYGDQGYGPAAALHNSSMRNSGKSDGLGHGRAGSRVEFGTADMMGRVPSGALMRTRSLPHGSGGAGGSRDEDMMGSGGPGGNRRGGVGWAPAWQAREGLGGGPTAGSIERGL